MREDACDLETEQSLVWLGGSQRIGRAMGRKAAAQSGRTLEAVKGVWILLRGFNLPKS